MFPLLIKGTLIEYTHEIKTFLTEIGNTIAIDRFLSDIKKNISVRKRINFVLIISILCYRNIMIEALCRKRHKIALLYEGFLLFP